jgi:hypothetical protein
METVGEKRNFPAETEGDRQIELALAGCLPSLFYAVNRVLEESSPAFSKKVGVVLLAFENASQQDEVGKYLTTADIANLFRDTFVASESSFKSEASKVKNDLFALNFVKVEGGKDHFHLTAKGESAAKELLRAASTHLREALQVLSPAEQRQLLNFAERLIVSRRKIAPTVKNDSGFNEGLPKKGRL